MKNFTNLLKFNSNNSSSSSPSDPNIAQRALKGLAKGTVGLITQPVNLSVNLFNKVIETNEVCYICETPFTLIQKKHTCLSCGRLVCKDHSISKGAEEERLCESCHHEKLVEETDSKSQAVKQEIAQEIQKCIEERNDKTKQLTKFISKSRKLENKQKEQQADHERKEWELDQQFQKECDNNYKMEEEIKELKLQLEASQSIEERTVQKTARGHEEVEIMRLKINGMLEEKKKVENELNELKEFIRSQVPVQIIKENLCQICYQNVRRAYSKTFKPVVQGEGKGGLAKIEDIKRDICACNII
ncbi:unnamed protein product [Blepharisma stoltei]|uniref:FYVE-type domain-containing protein n=1 Tax=Blepharisma stoltei TaxID=1481888 RepID=A0AAU9IM32_9CILI|nr:unnamed protein product [Blepharisma stoltei]